MRKRARKVLLPLSSVAAVLALLCAIILAVLQTGAFRNQVRSRLISALERASGGRVELQSFNFDWRTLTAQVDNLVIRGTEASGSPPLLRVASVHIQLTVTSLLERKVDVSSVIADRPQAFLLVRPDGSTNIPQPRFDPQTLANQLLDLKIKSFVLHQGVLLVNAKRYSFELRGQDLRAVATYLATQSAYQLSLISRRVSLDAACCRSLPFDVETRGTLSKNIIHFQQISLAAPGAKLQAKGTLTHFNSPEADFQFDSSLALREAAQIVGFPSLSGGNLVLSGSARLDGRNGFSIDGILQAQRLTYPLSNLAVSTLDLTSHFHASNSAVVLSDISANALGGKFTGAATLDRSRAFRVTGRLLSVDLQHLMASLGYSSPWSGSVSGPLSADSVWGAGFRNLSLQTALEIASARGAIPLSGRLHISKTAGSSIRFGDSHLTFSRSELSFHGSSATGIETLLDSTSLADVSTVLEFMKIKLPSSDLPLLLPGGSIHFSGSLNSFAKDPSLRGVLALARFEIAGQKWNELDLQGAASAHDLDFSSLALDSPDLHLEGKGNIPLDHWHMSHEGAVRFQGNYSRLDLAALHSHFATLAFPLDRGIAAGVLNISGTFRRPLGSLTASVQNPAAYGEQFKRLTLAATLEETGLRISQASLNGRVDGRIDFSGAYTHAPDDWLNGQLAIKVHSENFSLSNLNFPHHLASDLAGDFDLNARLEANVQNGALRPAQVNGHLALRDLSAGGVALGTVSSDIDTQNQSLNLALHGDLRESSFHGDAQVALLGDQPVKGELRFDRLTLATLATLFRPAKNRNLPAQGFLDGSLKFEGPLAHPLLWHSNVQLDHLRLTSLDSSSAANTKGFALYNSRPIALALSDGQAKVQSFELLGQDTKLTLSGSVGYTANRPLNLNANGSVDLQLLRLLDPNLQSSGESQLEASIGGTLANPSVKGRLELKNAFLQSPDFANGLRSLNGAVTFQDNRATIETLTATSGGGILRLTGFVTYSGFSPLVYNLNARADNVRVTYASISATANTDLHLTGTSASSLLSGTATISRVVFNPSTDVGNVLTSFAAPVPTPANQKDFLTGLHLDVAIESAPTLQLSTALSRDVESEIDLRLRGTPERPVLLGSILANQGDIRVFGTRYSINRGEVSFVNATTIDPVLDLDLQTQTRGITVDITISGTLNRLNISYRSDPPLQPRDIIALLTVGRTPQEASNVQNTQVTTDTTALQSGANNVLGQAISQPSSRLSKLFGVTNIRLDPLVQGITNTTQSRLTLEQQISRAITVTYITNLEQTSEQIFRLEWSINRQYSVVAVRDDNGEFGIDIQYKKRFK